MTDPQVTRFEVRLTASGVARDAQGRVLNPDGSIADDQTTEVEMHGQPVNLTGEQIQTLMGDRRDRRPFNSEPS